MIKDIPRQTLLKIGAGVAAGLFILDSFVIEPAFHAWGEQSERIESLQKKVDRGRTLLARESTIRGRWAEMLGANLPPDISAAEDEAFRAIDNWKADSGIVMTSISPQWQAHEDGGYDTFECRAVAVGDQVSLGRFIYDMEVDPAPVNLDECEIVTRDAHGQQLTMSARFSFVRLSPESGAVSSSSSSASSSVSSSSISNSGRATR